METMPRQRRFPAWMPAAALVAITLVAYLPALRAQWVWDDDYYVTNNETLLSAHGLKRIWTEIGAVPQYYPLVHTSFWIEHKLWGFSPRGYHLDNVLLHAISCVLLWRILLKLEVPGAWLAAAVFAVHPMHVESVAWVTERKNVLSGALYLAAGLAYLHFLDRRRRGLWALAFAMFVLALLSKTVTCSLPAAILVIVWWKRGRITPADLSPLVPFFIVGAAMAMLTGWMEKHVVGAWGPEWQINFAERCIIAGRALWFYVGKLLLPWPLVFLYPRWTIRWNAWWLYLLPLSVLIVLVVLITVWRRIGRGPAAAALFFIATLFPALGFVNTLPMRYSFVADHFVYLASLGLIVPVIAVMGRARTAVATPILIALACLTFNRCFAFADAETLWRDTLAKNPSAWMAHHNFGNILLGRDRLDEAETEFNEAIRLKPDHVEARVSLGQVAEKRNQPLVAQKWYREAIGVDPHYAPAHYNLARLLSINGDSGAAIGEYERTIELNPRFRAARQNLARLYNSIGAQMATEARWADAEALFHRAIALDPAYADPHINLGIVLEKQGKSNEARQQYLRALQIDPNSARARQRLAQQDGAGTSR